MSLHNFGPGLDFWKIPHHGGHAVIMAPPKHKQQLIRKLMMNNIDFSEVVRNLEEYIRTNL